MTKIGHIYVIDDDDSVRLSLTRMLNEIGYTAEQYPSGKRFLAESVPISPSVIILDMQMPDMTGIELQQKLLELNRKTPIIFISGQSHPHQIISALKRGAVDFLIKPFNMDELLIAINNAIDFDQRQFTRLSKELDAKQCFQSLTLREKEVCALLVEGLLNKDIAVKLGITDATVKVHKARVMEKMRADSLQSLVRLYLDSGLNHRL